MFEVMEKKSVFFSQNPITNGALAVAAPAVVDVCARLLRILLGKKNAKNSCCTPKKFKKFFFQKKVLAMGGGECAKGPPPPSRCRNSIEEDGNEWRRSINNNLRNSNSIKCEQRSTTSSVVRFFLEIYEKTYFLK